MTQKEVDFGNNSILPINEFKLSSMCIDPSIVMIAKRGSGKSVLCRAILKHFKNIPVGMIIAPTDKINNFYGSFFPELYVHYGFKSEIIEKLLHRQELIIEKSKRHRNLNPSAFIVMDDCLAKKKSWMKDEQITELLYNGRHYKITYILTMQYPLGITPDLRCNFDYIFLLAEDLLTNQKKMYEHYAGMFPNLNSFKAAFSVLTENHGCMVIVNRGARKEFRDKVFWYKAEDKECPRNVIGCRQFWKFNENNYNINWKKKDKRFNIDECVAKTKKAGGTLKVEKIGEDDNKPKRKALNCL